MNDPMIGKLTGEVFKEVFRTVDEADVHIVIACGTKVLPGYFAVTLIEGKRAITVALCPHAIEEMVSRIAAMTKEIAS